MARRRRCARGPLAYVVVAVLGVGLARGHAESCSRTTRSPIARRRSRASSRSCPRRRRRRIARAVLRRLRLPAAGQGTDRGQPRPEPLRLGARPSRVGDRDSARRLAHEPERVGLAGCGRRPAPASSSSSSSSAGSESITGPSLQIEGCAGGHEAVARFLAALGDVDGVTRVSVLKLGPARRRRARAVRPRPPVRGRRRGARGAPVATSSPSSRSSPRLTRSRSTRRPRGLRQPTPTTPDERLRPRRPPDQSQVADAEQQLQQQKDSAAQKTAEGPQGRGHLHPRDRDGAMRRNELTIVLSLAVIGLIVGVLAGGPGAEARPGGEPQAGRRPAPVAARPRRSRRPRRASRSRGRSRSTTGSSWCWARRSPRTATRPASWSSSSSSPTAPASGSNRSTWRTPQARRPRPPRRPPPRRVPRAHVDQLHRDRDTSTIVLDHGRQLDGLDRSRAAEPARDATEASAATLPIGASIGPAGLPVMPYDLTFTGDFFQIADFMKRLDAMVHTRQGTVDVTGRLLTVDAFTLAPIQSDDADASPWSRR